MIPSKALAIMTNDQAIATLKAPETKEEDVLCCSGSVIRSGIRSCTFGKDDRSSVSVMSSPVTIPRELQPKFQFNAMTAKLQGYNDMEAKLK
jgi:hypothetical protein